MEYPGRIIKTGEGDATVVRAIIGQLGKFGYLLAGGHAAYDGKLTALVRLFQSQQVDEAGRPLVVDGTIGPMTWGALFGAKTNHKAVRSIAGAALDVAIGEIGTMEKPLGSNRGPEVDAYLASVHVPSGNFWCMAFVYWCFREAAKSGVANPFPKTGGCLDAWNKVKKANPGAIVTAAQAVGDPGLVKPGFVFILDHGGGLGHTGFVRSVTGGALGTVEGNSNPTGSRNGIGVFDINRRKVTERGLKGFIDFTKP